MAVQKPENRKRNHLCLDFSALTSVKALADHLGWSEAQQTLCQRVARDHPLRIPTGYFENACTQPNPTDRRALLRMVIPDPREREPGTGLQPDPLAEERHSPFPGLVHRYPDRVLLLLTTRCAAYCRFCTRRRLIGQRWAWLESGRLARCVAYLRDHPRVREVIVSGGDPLVLTDSYLAEVLQQLRGVPSVRVIRLGTRMPVMVPERITTALAGVLADHAPLYVLTHINHPAELTEPAEKALCRLADRGLVLANQTVLLRGVNDSAEVLGLLFRRLLERRVRPYCLHQCDLTTGVAHFRTPLKRGVALMRALRAHLSGLALPKLVVDIPGGGGKVDLSYDPIVERRGDTLILENPEGRRFFYPECCA
jgi:lysine 2,3-aminomutase